MLYRVEITPRAQADLAAIFDYIHASEMRSSLRWYERLEARILSLETMPRRGRITRHNRYLLYGRKNNRYIIYFRIRESARLVEVLHIRHGARKPL